MSKQQNDVQLVTVVSNYHFGQYQNSRKKKDSLENGYIKVGTREMNKTSSGQPTVADTRPVIKDKCPFDTPVSNHTGNNLSINESTAYIDLNVLSMFHIHTTLNSLVTMAVG